MKTLLLLALTLILTACGPRKQVTLKWPELQALDHEVEELDGLLAGEPDPAAVAEHIPHVQQALEKLFASEIPAAANHPELVAQKLSELNALAAEVGTSSDVLPALHPLVVTIMEEAGMPHVHDEHHEHEGHDH